MGYETDHPPIVYLERRIKYYKKMRGRARSLPKDKFFIKQYGKRGITQISNQSLARYESRIKEYERAIEILKKNEKSA